MSLGPLPGGRPVDARLWCELNQALIARAISELTFEEGLKPEPLDQQHELWTLRLGETVSYRFRAKRRIWGNLAIEPRSLSRHEGAFAAPADDVAGFMIDARTALEIEPDTLAIYIRELSSTLFSDARVAAINAAIGEDELITLPDHLLQHYLDGHPKAPAAKGRIGWGLGDAEAYAPEFQAELQLFWVAAARDACQISHDPSVSEDDLLAASLDPTERGRLEEACLEACRRLGTDRSRYLLMPVHPWQWDNMVALQFAGEIAAGRLLPLGSFGSGYLPQQSLRTLANASAPAHCTSSSRSASSTPRPGAACRGSTWRSGRPSRPGSRRRPRPTPRSLQPRCCANRPAPSIRTRSTSGSRACPTSSARCSARSGANRSRPIWNPARTP